MEISLVVARHAYMVAELVGLATVTIQVGLEKMAKVAGHLRTIVGALFLSFLNCGMMPYQKFQ